MAQDASGRGVNARYQFQDRSGEIKGQAMAQFGQQIGASIAEGRRKKEEKQQSTAAIEYFISKGMPEEEAKWAVKGLGSGPEAIKVIGVFEENRKKRELDQQLAQQKALMDWIETQKKDIQQNIDNQNMFDDNTRANEQLAVSKAAEERQANKPTQAEEDIQYIDQMVTAKNTAVESGDKVKAAMIQGKLDKTNLPYGSSLIIGADGSVQFSQGQGGLNTSPEQTKVQTAIRDLDQGINVSQSVVENWDNDYVGVSAWFKDTFINRTPIGDLLPGSVDQRMVQFRAQVVEMAQTSARLALPGERMTKLDYDNISKMLPNPSDFFSNADRSKAAAEQLLRAQRAKRGVMRIHQQYPDFSKPISSLSEDELIKLFPGDPDTVTDLLTYNQSISSRKSPTTKQD